MAANNGSEKPATIRLAALGDCHIREANRGALQAVLAQVAQAADVLVLCGDLTDHGLTDEAKVLAAELSAAKVQTVGVLGNHDYEGGHSGEIAKVLTDAGMTLLDGEAVEIKGVGFAGVKGFGGGFGRGTLSAFGEPATKAFVQEALHETMKLEAALLRLRTLSKIAVLHYSPIRGTVENEPPEIFPFLGCSRLEEPINRYQVTACVHGHAHNGAPEGKTAAGVPVFNVALPLMRKLFPDRPPFRILEVPVGPVQGTEAAKAAAGPVMQGAVESRV
ncbi:MAG TPA: metallophosphoesterase [Tepidisphaeraceae bacterium]|nr:metallophosphoesterase [Tepidisphaeraceae bacterium]